MEKERGGTMIIKKIFSEENNKGATVQLDYGDVRDIANALYYLTSGKEPDEDYSKIAAKFALLFDMVKFGMVQPHTVARLNKTII